jgi:hypothetical protein
MRASNANVISVEERNLLLSKAYEYTKAHPSPYIPALVVLIRISELERENIVSDAERMVDEFFEMPEGDRPDYFEAEQNYKKFLTTYITPVF